MKFYLARDVTLRVCPTGALAFRSSDGLRIRFNASGGRLLSLLHGRSVEQAWELMREVFPDSPSIPDSSSHQIIAQALKFGLLSTEESPAGSIIEYGSKEAPEVVHLLVTDKCNYRCPSCYIDRGRCDEHMSLEELKKLVAELSEMGVLELAIGGGEPFLRDDILEIISYASSRLVVNVTTNGSLIDLAMAKKLKESGINLVQISVNGPDETTNSLSRETGTWTTAVDALTALDLAGVRTGVNVVVTRQLLGRIEETVKLFAELGAHQIVLVRSKPRHAGDEWFHRNAPGIWDYPALSKEIQGLPARFPGIVLTVDSTFGPLFEDLPVEELGRHGFRGLAGGRISCCIDADGSVYPGSHFMHRDFFAGNVRIMRFRRIWDESTVLREFAEVWKDLNGACRDCDHLSVCMGGCRKTALMGGNLHGEDEYCVRAAAH